MNSFDKIIYKIVRYGLFFAAFAPLIIFRNAFSPFNFGKVVVFRTLVEILLALYIYLAIKYPEFRPRIKNLIFIALFLFTVSFIFSTFIGVNWQNSFWGSFERMGGLFSWLHYFAFFIILVSIFKTKEDWFTLLKLSILVSLISIIYGFLQRLNIPWIVGAEERIRILGTIGNPAAFGGYLIFNIYFALFFLVSSIKNNKGRILNAKSLFYFLVIVIESIAVLMTSVRGSILALYSTFFIFLLICGFNLIKKRKFRTLLACLVIICLIVVIIGLNSTKLIHYFQLERITKWSFNQPVIQSRLMVWQEAVIAIKEKPFLGWGPENFNIPYVKYYNPQLFRGAGSELIFDRAHNVFLDTGATQGILGLITYVFLWGVVILGIRRLTLKNKEFKVLYFLIVAYFIQNFFFFDAFSTYLMGIFVIGLVYVLGMDNKGFKFQVSSFKFSNILLLIILLSLSVALVFQANIKPALANFYSTRGAVALSQDKYQKGMDYFKKALSKANWATLDTRRNFTEFYVDAIFRMEGKILEKDLVKDLDYLIKELEQEKQKNKLDYVNYHYLHKAYRAKALFLDLDFSQSEEALQKAISLAPNMVYLYYDLAELEFRKENYPAVLEISQKAYELNPQWLESKFKFSQALVLNNKTEQGISLAIEAVKQGYRKPADINWVGQQLDKAKKFQKLIDFYEYLVSQIGPKYNVQLSYSYLQANNLEKAEMIADKVLAMDFESIGQKGFELLAEIYQALGNEDKRAKAAAKAFGIE